MVYVQILKNQSDFHQGLKDLNEEMRRLLSGLVDIKDHVTVDSLRISVIASMKAILEASQYIRDYLEGNKFGEYDQEECQRPDSEYSGSRKTTVVSVSVQAQRVPDHIPSAKRVDARVEVESIGRSSQ